MTPQEEMKKVEEFRRTGRGYVNPNDEKEMDFTTRPAPGTTKEKQETKEK